MTPIWQDGPVARLEPWAGRPVVWSVATRTDPGIRPLSADLADAAGAGDGAARLARRLLARVAVAMLSGVPAGYVRIVRGPRGAPVIVDPSGWHLSLAGDREAALIGVARVPLGVDREPLEEAAVPWDLLSATEAAELRRLPQREQSVAWLRRWTIKEAHAKLVGDPRRIGPEQIETLARPDGSVSACFEGRSSGWSRIAGDAVETVLWHSPDREIV